MYVGKTTFSIEKRYKQHLIDCHRANIKNRPLYKAMNKYGQDNFYIEELEKCSLEKLSEREKYWIEYLGTFKDGYNATVGGDGIQLYDYQKIIDRYLNSENSIKEIALEFGCSTDTVSHILKKINCNTHCRQIIKMSKKILMKDFSGKILYYFNNKTLAAQWVADNCNSSGNIEAIKTNIGRVANGKRKSAFGYKWEYY